MHRPLQVAQLAYGYRILSNRVNLKNWLSASNQSPSSIKNELEYTLLPFLGGGIGYTTLFNRVKREDENWYLSKVIRKTGNSLQQDLLRSYFFEDVVMMTLKNGKVYVGLVSELHEPHPESSYVRLVLFYSGYRDDKMDVCLEKDYNLNINSEKSDKDEDMLVSVVVAEAEILSMTFYDQDIYDRLNVMDLHQEINANFTV